MKKNLLKIYESFFDDLDKLNQDKVNDEFGDVNRGIYDEHDVILSKDKNPEFFYGLCDMCKKYYPDLPSNENWFTQEDLNKIIYIRSDFKSESYFKDVTSLDELQYFYNLKRVWVYTLINCEKLKSVIFPENLQIIHACAFSKCSSLKEIIFPKSLKEIGQYSFSKCSSLKEIIFPKSLKEIGQYSFSKCSSLKEIIFPKNISNIEYNSFQDCTSLEKIVIPEKFEKYIKTIFHYVDLTNVNITYI